MKKNIIIILLIAVYSSVLPAQEINKGPSLNPDLMAYFQDELTSLVQFQKSMEKGEYSNSDEEEVGISPFIVSARFKITNTERTEYSSYYGNLIDIKEALNMIGNILIGTQIKITDNFYIPLFACSSYYQIIGYHDDETLFFENNPVYGGTILDEDTSFYFGSGIVFNRTNFYLGVFAGYYLDIYKTTYNYGKYRPFGTLEIKDYYFVDEGISHSFKIALIPDIKTSNWKYVGVVLSKILGYIGMGNIVDIYLGGKEENTYENIAGLLNFGFNLFFNKINIGKFSIEPHFYYSRGNYDAIAKNEDFGFLLSGNINIFGVYTNLGYRNFYSVSPYFVSHYTNNMFFGIGISVFSFSLNYSFDFVRNHQFSLIFNLRDSFSLIGEVGGIARDRSNDLYEKKVISGGSGIRYRMRPIK